MEKIKHPTHGKVTAKMTEIIDRVNLLTEMADDHQRRDTLVAFANWYRLTLDGHFNFVPSIDQYLMTLKPNPGLFTTDTAAVLADGGEVTERMVRVAEATERIEKNNNIGAYDVTGLPVGKQKAILGIVGTIYWNNAGDHESHLYEGLKAITGFEWPSDDQIKTLYFNLMTQMGEL